MTIECIALLASGLVPHNGHYTINIQQRMLLVKKASYQFMKFMVYIGQISACFASIIFSFTRCLRLHRPPSCPQTQSTITPIFVNTTPAENVGSPAIPGYGSTNLICMRMSGVMRQIRWTLGTSNWGLARFMPIGGVVKTRKMPSY